MTTPSSDSFDYSVDSLAEDGIHIHEVRSGKFSPIMTSDEELSRIAKEVAIIIEDNDRSSLSFDDFLLVFDASFVPDCDINHDASLLIDTGTYSKQAGNMTVDMLNEVVNTKLHCQECPLKRECLAVSMTGVQNTRMSRTERTLPKRPGDTTSQTLVMDDFLIFGGLTPQERRRVYHKVCDILEENNRTICSEDS